MKAAYLSDTPCFFATTASSGPPPPLPPAFLMPPRQEEGGFPERTESTPISSFPRSCHGMGFVNCQNTLLKNQKVVVQYFKLVFFILENLVNPGSPRPLFATVWDSPFEQNKSQSIFNMTVFNCNIFGAFMYFLKKIKKMVNPYPGLGHPLFSR